MQEVLVDVPDGDTDAFEITQPNRRGPLVLQRDTTKAGSPPPTGHNRSQSLYASPSKGLEGEGGKADEPGRGTPEGVDVSCPVRIPTRTPNKNFTQLKNKWEDAVASPTNGGKGSARGNQSLNNSDGSPTAASPPSSIAATSPSSLPSNIGITVTPPSSPRPREATLPKATSSPSGIRVAEKDKDKDKDKEKDKVKFGSNSTPNAYAIKGIISNREKKMKKLSHSSDAIVTVDNKIVYQHAKLVKAVKAESELREKEKHKEEKEKMKEEKEKKEKEEKVREKEERERREREKKEMKMKRKEEKERERLEEKMDKLKSPMTPRKRPVFGRRKSFRSLTGGKERGMTGPEEMSGEGERPTSGKYVLPDEEVERQLNILNNASDIISLQVLPLADQQSDLDQNVFEPPPKNYIEGPNQNGDPDYILYPPDSGLGKYRVYGQTVSTYPRVLEIPGARQGDPICDCFSVKCYDNGLIFCVCDGCGWGNAACTAAKTVRSTFMKRLHETATQSEKRSVFDLANFLLEVLAQSHNDIMEGKEAWECGSTTVVAGLLMDLEKDGEPTDQQGLLMISVGDCKVYRFDIKQGTVSDLTFGSRLNLLNPSDCGGRLGPTLGEEMALLPDLRNLRLSFLSCNKGDILWVVSDGVHDNIDPQWMGLQPKDMGYKELRGIESWGHEILENDQALLGRIKNDFSVNLLQMLFLRTPKAKQEMLKLKGLPTNGKAAGSDDESEGEDESTMTLSSDSEDDHTGATDLLKRYFGDDYNDIMYVGSGKRIPTRRQSTSQPSPLSRKPEPQPATTTAPGTDDKSNGNSSNNSNNAEREERDKIIFGKWVEEDVADVVKEDEGEEDDEGISPRTITRALIRHALKVTSATRNFMEANPNKRQPEDLLNYPGKMDHTTCVAFRI